MHGSQVGGHGLTFVKIEKTYTNWKVPWWEIKYNFQLSTLVVTPKRSVLCFQVNILQY